MYFVRSQILEFPLEKFYATSLLSSQVVRPQESAEQESTRTRRYNKLLQQKLLALRHR